MGQCHEQKVHHGDDGCLGSDVQTHVKPELSKNVTSFKGPKCHESMASSTRFFQHDDLDVSAKCDQCKCSSTMKMWECNCELKWHLCDTHKHAYCSKQTEKVKPSDSLQNTSKRSGMLKIPKLRYEDILADDVRKDIANRKRKKDNDVDLGLIQRKCVSVRIQSSNLTKRFPKCCVYDF